MFNLYRNTVSIYKLFIVCVLALVLVYITVNIVSSEVYVKGKEDYDVQDMVQQQASKVGDATISANSVRITGIYGSNPYEILADKALKSDDNYLLSGIYGRSMVKDTVMDIICSDGSWNNISNTLLLTGSIGFRLDNYTLQSNKITVDFKNSMVSANEGMVIKSEYGNFSSDNGVINDKKDLHLSGNVYSNIRIN